MRCVKIGDTGAGARPTRRRPQVRRRYPEVVRLGRPPPEPRAARRASPSRPRTSPGPSARSPSIRRARKLRPCWRCCGAPRSRRAGSPSPPSAPSPICSAWPTSACSRSRPSTRCSSLPRWARRPTCGCAARRPCMLRGSEALIEVCKERIAEHPHELSQDGHFSWEEVECLGCCSNAPCRADRQGYVRGPHPRAV